MREIKFRIWDEEEHKMERALAVDWFFKTAITSANPVTNSHPRGVSFRDKDEILMQYTGMKDQTGREIYEGDIVKFISRLDDSKRMGTVRYWAGDAAFLIECEREIFFLFHDALNREVIGNIYENPEILKDRR